MSALVQLIVYCVCIFGISLVGGWIPTVWKLRERHMHRVMSLVAGLMLGVALLHMLPHAVHRTGMVDRCALASLIGLLTMFFLIRVFHVHQHHMGDDPHAGCSHGLTHHEHYDHAHSHSHEPSSEKNNGGIETVTNAAAGSASGPTPHSFSWLGLAFGLGVHTLIDGMALGAAVQIDAEHPGTWLFGVGTFAAVFLHKPLDALSITTTMASAGWSRSMQLAANVMFGLMCPLGAFLFVAGVSQTGNQGQLVGLALAFSSGVFLCIALADLLPEVAFHSQDGTALATALLMGIGLAGAIGLIEPAHLHEESHSGQTDGHDHDHDHNHGESSHTEQGHSH